MNEVYPWDKYRHYAEGNQILVNGIPRTVLKCAVIENNTNNVLFLDNNTVLIDGELYTKHHNVNELIPDKTVKPPKLDFGDKDDN